MQSAVLICKLTVYSIQSTSSTLPSHIILNFIEYCTVHSMKISRDEVAMLEHELRRAKSENAGLRVQLDKAER